MAKCIIVGAGIIEDLSIFDKYILSDDYIICADGGYIALNKTKFSPDLIVGDFDSSPLPDFDNIVVLPVEKDMTDTLQAVKIGIEKGYTDFVILGSLGGRVDHSYSNILTLKYIYDKGCKGILANDVNIIYFIKDNEFEICRKEFNNISFFAFENPVSNFCISGAKYCIEGYNLKPSDSLCVSNSFENDIITIRKDSGILLVIESM